MMTREKNRAGPTCLAELMRMPRRSASVGGSALAFPFSLVQYDRSICCIKFLRRNRRT